MKLIAHIVLAALLVVTTVGCGDDRTSDQKRGSEQPPARYDDQVAADNTDKKQRASAKTPPDSDKKTGGVTGRVVYRADPKRPWRQGRYYLGSDGELAEAVVALQGEALTDWPAADQPKTVTIDQADFRFVPESVAIRAGDRVRFTNSDAQVHNVSSNHRRYGFSNNMEPGQEFAERFARPVALSQPVVLGCLYHDSMRAWIYVLAHPFFQMTADDGKFQFDGLPPGKYRLLMRHPAGDLKANLPVEIKAGKTLRLDIRVSPDDRVE